MDKFTNQQEKLIIDLTIKNLNDHNINAYYVPNTSELKVLLDKFMCKNSIVCTGGSMTLKEFGVIDYLNSNDFIYECGEDAYQKAYTAHTYLMSSNAITSDGAIINMDGRANRVSAMLYGPKQVIIIVGKNKIVKDEAAAITRLEMVTAPANAMRLGCKTPCAISGVCEHCNSKFKICRAYVKLTSQIDNERIKVIIVNENAGY